MDPKLKSFKMWWTGIYFVNVVFCSELNTINFKIDYLSYRDTGFVCLLTCNNYFWDTQYAKMALNASILVSKVNVNNISLDINNDESVDYCLRQQTISIGVIIDSECMLFEELMYFASQNKYLGSMHKWLVIYNGNSTDVDYYNSTSKMAAVFDKLNISVDTDIVLASKNENSIYKLYDIFNFGKIQGGDLVINDAGLWDSNFGLTMYANLNKYKYYRRWNFMDLAMRMVLVVSPAPTNVDLELLSEIKPVPGVATITQISVATLFVVAEIHNFRYIPTITDRWISTFERNSTKAVSNMVYFGEQDISPVIRFLYDIHEKIDLLYPPLATIETKYYYKIPSFGPGKFENQFLRPLSYGAWWCIIAISTLCAVLLLLSARLERRPLSAQYAIFSVIASICQQFFQDIGDNVTRRESSARKLTILVTGMACVLIYNYYTSSVVSWLLNGPPPSINSLQELLDSPLELIYEDVGYTRSWLQTPTYYFNNKNAKIEDEIRIKKVFNKKKNAPLFVTLNKGIRLVKDGGYAFHAETHEANDLISKTFMQDELCELGSLQSMPKADLYPCVQKNSPFKEFLTWSLLQVSERGVLSRIKRRTSSTDVRCEGSSPRALALGGAAPAFILLATGYTMAVIIMMVERCRFNLELKNRQQ